MLIDTHPLMKKEVSEELTHSIKIKSAREKNRRAVSEDLEAETNSAPAEEAEETAAENVSASKDPVEEPEERQDDDVDSPYGRSDELHEGACLIG